MRKHAMSGIFFIFCLLLASLSFLGGYYAVQNYFAVPEAVSTFVGEYRKGNHPVNLEEDGFESLEKVRAGLNAKIAPAAVRLDIFCVLEEKLEAVISVLDTREGTWKLYTFPADTRVELGETRYRRLTAQFPALPQMFEIGILTEYTGREQVGAVLSAVFEDMLFCRFQTTICCTKEELSAWCIKEGEKYTPTKEVLEFFAKSPLEKNLWQQINQREEPSLCYYAEALALLSEKNIAAQLIAGERLSDGYRLNENLARRQLAGSEIAR